ncbi:MAG: beta-ketoacyl-ACP synthase III [Gemmatimonadota bacterium]
MRHPKPLARIVSTGRFLPDNVVTNDDLAARMDTSDEWIRTRTGIRERRIAPDDLTAAAMGAESAKKAMAEAGVNPGEVDVLIVCTATPDRWLPSTACDIQAVLGCRNAFAYDLHAACSGFLYSLTMAEGYLHAGRGEIALVVSTEKMSAIVDWSDRSTCVLFGDGSGAAVVRPTGNGDGGGGDGSPEPGILSSVLRSDGNLADLLYRPAGGNAEPLSPEVLERGEHLVHMAGREVFKNAVRSMAEAAQQALANAGLTADDVDLMVPHQANVRIIEATAKYAGIPMERVYINLDRFGNMSSASIPVALDEVRESGLVGPGTNVLTAAFGAGLTWGAQVWRF